MAHFKMPIHYHLPYLPSNRAVVLDGYGLHNRYSILQRGHTYVGLQNGIAGQLLEKQSEVDHVNTSTNRQSTCSFLSTSHAEETDMTNRECIMHLLLFLCSCSCPHSYSGHLFIFIFVPFILFLKPYPIPYSCENTPPPISTPPTLQISFSSSTSSFASPNPPCPPSASLRSLAWPPSRTATLLK